MDGTTDDLKARAKEAVGDLTSDADLKREGRADRAGGKLKNVVDDVTDKAENVIDGVNDKAKNAIDGVKDKLHDD